MADLSPAMHPREHLARLLAAADGDRIAETIDLLILALDLRDGDTDRESNGDELDGTRAEDDFVSHNTGGPGCPLADPAAFDGDERDASFPEWRADGAARVARSTLEEEDAEDDDPSEDADSDFGADERGEAWTWPERVHQRDCMVAGLRLNNQGDEGEPWLVPVTLNKLVAAND